VVGPLATGPSGRGQQRGDLGPGLIGELVAADHATSPTSRSWQPPDPTTRAVRQPLVADQAALHGLLAKVRDLGLPLLSVRQIDPNQ
jgi:hypothetical protein